MMINYYGTRVTLSDTPLIVRSLQLFLVAITMPVFALYFAAEGHIP